MISEWSWGQIAGFGPQSYLLALASRGPELGAAASRLTVSAERGRPHPPRGMGVPRPGTS